MLNGEINLTKDSEHGKKYYKDNQIPKKLKSKVEGFYNQTFKTKEKQIKKIATFASPGFNAFTDIYDNHSQKSKIVYNYKMNEDVVSHIGSNKYLLGRNKWMISGLEGMKEQHAIESYYKKFNGFFNDSTYEQNE